MALLVGTLFSLLSSLLCGAHFGPECGTHSGKSVHQTSNERPAGELSRGRAHVPPNFIASVLSLELLRTAEKMRSFCEDIDSAAILSQYTYYWKSSAIIIITL